MAAELLDEPTQSLGRGDQLIVRLPGSLRFTPPKRGVLLRQRAEAQFAEQFGQLAAVDALDLRRPPVEACRVSYGEAALADKV